MSALFAPRFNASRNNLSIQSALPGRTQNLTMILPRQYYGYALQPQFQFPEVHSPGEQVTDLIKEAPALVTATAAMATCVVARAGRDLVGGSWPAS